MRRRPQAALLALTLVNVLVLAGSLSVAVTGLPGADVKPHLRNRGPVNARPVLSTPPPEGRGRASSSTGGGTVASAVTEAMRAPGLGGSVAAMVVDPTSGETVLRHRAKAAVTPASTAKLLTAAAALTALGPAAQLRTETVRGKRPGTVVLVGGGDPTLAGPEAEHRYPKPARLGKLARRTAEKLRASSTSTVRLQYDASLFTGPATAGTWKSGYVPSGYVAPVTALSVDGARAQPGRDGDRVSDPPEAAAEAFAALLEDQGITVRGVAQGGAPDEPQRLAAVKSPPTSTLVETMLATSDNDIAEALGRHVALEVGKPASFGGAAAAVTDVVGRLGVPTAGVRLDDSSGLSHTNELTARALAGVLSLAAGQEHPELRPVLTGLPIAGYSGTLRDRYTNGSAGAAAGFVRAKTGTLTGVSTLAGVAYQPNGEIAVFSFLADHVSPGRYAPARAALDDMAAVLVRPGRTVGR